MKVVSTSCFDEMFSPNGIPRSNGADFVQRRWQFPDGVLQERQRAAEISLKNMGITFNVYGLEAGTEKGLAVRSVAPNYRLE